MEEERGKLSVLEEPLMILMKGSVSGCYGFDLMNQLNCINELFGIPKIKMGSLYPTLKRLEQKGLIVGRWGGDETGGARRRYYILSSKGESALANVYAYRKQLQKVSASRN